MRRIIQYFQCAACVLCAHLSRGADLPPSDIVPVRARVVEVENTNATLSFIPQNAVVQQMMDHGIMKMTGKGDLRSAWRSIVSTKDIVGIKVYSTPGASSGTRPAVVSAVVEGLLRAGLAPSHIILWDKRLVDLRLAGFDDLADRYKIRLAGAADSGYDEDVSYDNPIMGSLVAGDYDFDHNGATSGKNSYFSKLLTHTITKIINISPLLNHNYAGVCGNLYSLSMGSVDNTLRFEGNPKRLSEAVPEIYGRPTLSDRVVLNITDALIGQYQGEQTSMLHYSVPLNQIWLSKDPVALDALSIEELDRERLDRKIEPGGNNLDLYQNASFLMELGVSDLAKIRIDTVK